MIPTVSMVAGQVYVETDIRGTASESINFEIDLTAMMFRAHLDTEGYRLRTEWQPITCDEQPLGLRGAVCRFVPVVGTWLLFGPSLSTARA